MAGYLRDRTAAAVIPVVLAPLLIAVIMTAIQQPGHGSRRALLAAAFPVCATAAATPQFLRPQPVLQVPGWGPAVIRYALPAVLLAAVLAILLIPVPPS